MIYFITLSMHARNEKASDFGLGGQSRKIRYTGELPSPKSFGFWTLQKLPASDVCGHVLEKATEQKNCWYSQLFGSPLTQKINRAVNQ